MTRLILLILLITLVYSWDEFNQAILALWRKFRRHKHQNIQLTSSDALISDVVVIATLPLNLAYLLISSDNLVKKLFIILIEFLILILLLRGLEEFHKRENFTKKYSELNRFAALGFSILGLVSPTWRLASNTVDKTLNFGRYLSAYLIPLLIGIFLAWAVRTTGADQSPQLLNVLIEIAVFGLILNITIEILEKMFRLYRFHLSGLFRVLLGIVLIFLLKLWT
jgi:hypothetical protein